MLENKFEVKIMEHIATLSASGDYSRELNVVSFNDRPARLDVRAWRQDGSGSKTPLKGIQLTDNEASALCGALNQYIGGNHHE